MKKRTRRRVSLLLQVLILVSIVGASVLTYRYMRDKVIVLPVIVPCSEKVLPDTYGTQPEWLMASR